MSLRRLAYSFLLLLVSGSLLAGNKSEQKDSLVRLLGCNVLQQVEEGGINYRKALGNARFEHNNTLLICDTALWNVPANIIMANGHVRIIQNRTVLSSDKLTYFIDDNLAQFRGSLVQLQDKDKNTLRTHDLDYNTRDSVATFRRGAAFRDKDGQVIESDDGTYDAKSRNFSFVRNVNMYTDSVFVKTNSLDYNTGTGIAVFGSNTHAWKDDNMLTAWEGWYDHGNEIFNFKEKVHVMTRKQEAWCDTLVFYRMRNDVEMFGNVELLDTSRDVAAVAGYMLYIDSLKYIKMTRDPAVIAYTTSTEYVDGEPYQEKDTVYVGADTLIYWTVPRYLVPDSEVKASQKRLSEIGVDAITEYRRKTAEETRAAAEEARKKALEEDPNAEAAVNRGRRLPAPYDGEPEPVLPRWSFQIPDSLSSSPPQSLDSLIIIPPSENAVSAPADTAETAEESILKDSTEIGFLNGINNVKIFRRDMQVSCDSLVFSELDSLIRLYEKPVVWNEIKRQYSADSITVIVRNNSIDRASLMSRAFIIVQEDSSSFDQIKSTEMMAYFDSLGTLKRFDAMGGVSGLFFIEEKGSLATVNKFEAKMLTATFENGNLNEMNYFQDVKSDAYPVVQLKKDERLLKEFEWQPDRRPKRPSDVTGYVPRGPERGKYNEVVKPKFVQTDLYFPGYMKSVHELLARQDSIKQARRLEKLASDAVAVPAPSPDSLASAAMPDSLASAATEVISEQVQAEDDKLYESLDSLLVESGDSLVKGTQYMADLASRFEVVDKEKEKKKAEQEAKKAEKARKRQEKTAVREARWAELDARDAERQAVRDAKALAKQRAKTLKMVKARERQEAKEQRILEKYRQKYLKRQARKAKEASS